MSPLISDQALLWAKHSNKNDIFFLKGAKLKDMTEAHFRHIQGLNVARIFQFVFQ